MPWLLRAQPYDSTISATRTLYFSDVGFVTEPSDSPANTYWDRRIEVPLTVRRAMFSGSAIGGSSDLTFGDCTLANDDGFLDFLDNYDWDGRVVEISYSPLVNPGYADFEIVFNGTAERLVLGDESVVIEVRDLQIVLDNPYQTLKFAGTGGLEGTAEMKDQRKPRAIGIVRQIEPILLDSALNLYAWNDGASGSVLEVRDRGIILPFNADYASYALLSVAVIPSGEYATCNAEGVLRLGARPFGPLTISANGRTTPSNKFGDLAYFVITTSSTLSGADFATGTVSAINALCPQTIHHWYDGRNEDTMRDVIDALAESVGAYWGFNGQRKLEFGLFSTPKLVADFDFRERDLLNLAPLPLERRLKSQAIGYRRFYRPLGAGDVANSVTDVDIAALSQEWRIETYTDSGVATASLLAKEERVDTLLDTQADALAEATRRVGLHGPKRQSFEATVPFVSGLDVGVTVRITDSRFGLSSGKNFVAIETERNASDETSKVTLWG